MVIENKRNDFIIGSETSLYEKKCLKLTDWGRLFNIPGISLRWISFTVHFFRGSGMVGIIFNDVDTANLN